MGMTYVSYIRSAMEMRMWHMCMFCCAHDSAESPRDD